MLGVFDLINACTNHLSVYNIKYSLFHRATLSDSIHIIIITGLFVYKIF